MRKHLYLFFITFFVSVSSVYAQDGFPQDPPDDDLDIPIDGGVSILLASGIALGLGGVYKKTRREEVDELV